MKRRTVRRPLKSAARNQTNDGRAHDAEAVVQIGHHVRLSSCSDGDVRPFAMSNTPSVDRLHLTLL